MNDEEKKQLAPETPADVLDSHIDNHIQLPDENKFDNEPLMKEVTSHSNLSPHSIEKLYAHSMAPVTPESKAHETGDSEPRNDLMENLMSHPNTPKHLKQEFALKTFSPDNPQSDLHEELADSGILDENQLRRMAENVLGQGRTPHSYKHLPPSYYLKYFKARSQQDPEGLDEQQKEAHDREGKFAFKGLMDSSRHTPATLDATIDALSNNKHYDAQYGSGNHKLLEDLVDSREDLSKDQLNRVHQWMEANDDKNDHWRSRDAIDKILTHKNVDPTLLAKYATGKNVRKEALSNPNLPKESINAAIKRIKDPTDYYERNNMDALLQNPSITKPQVKTLIAKGSSRAMKHELADEEDVRNYWNKSSKSKDAAQEVLSAKRTPPDVLKELVNHKNQEVAVDALNHGNSDMDVVNEGLKRKAKTVQDAARVHPLVAESQVKEGLTSGKTSLSKAYADEDFSKHFDKMPKAEQEAIFQSAHQKYGGSNLDEIAKKSKERPEVVLHSKMELARDPRVPEAIREVHSKDIANLFKDKVSKNAEPKGNADWHVLSDKHEDESSRIMNAATELAHGGDKNAQHAILENPAALSALPNRIDMNTAPSDFLEAMYRQSQDYSRRNTEIYDRYGHPMKFKEGRMSKELLESTNLPEHVFHEIASNKEAMDSIGSTESFNRYNDLPPEQQDAKYSTILNSGSKGAAKSVLKTNAPPASWDRAFSMIEPDDRSNFLQYDIEHVKKHRPDIYHNTVMGLYNDERDTRAQEVAMKRLSPESPSDVSSLDQLISVPEGQQGWISDQDMSKMIPGKMLGPMQDDRLVDHAISSNRPDLAYNLLNKKLEHASREISHSKYTPEAERAEKIEQAKNLMTYLTGRVASMPSLSQGDNPLAENWYHLLTTSVSRADAFKNMKEAGINFDFLADMPGKDGELARRQALTDNLLSPEKLSALTQTSSMKDILAIGNLGLKQKAIDQYVAGQNHTKQDLSHLATHVYAEHLNPEHNSRGRKKKVMSEGARQVFTDRLNRLVDLYQAKDPGNLGTVVSRALYNPDTSSTLTVSDQEAAGKSVLEHIEGKAYATPSDKNSTMYEAMKGLQRRDAVPASMKKKLEKSVVESKDYDTMVKMAEAGDLSGNGMSALAKAAAQPGLLNASQIAGISSQLTSDSSPQSVIDMTKTFEQKIAEQPGKNLTADRTKFLNNIATCVNYNDDSPENKAKNEFVLNYTKKATLDPALAPVANTRLKQMATGISYSDMNEAMNIFESLPSDSSKFDGSQLVESVPLHMVNDPRFIAASSSGWKLRQLAANAQELTGDNTSVLVNRVLNDPEGTVNKNSLFNSMEQNQFAQPDDSVKLARNMTDDEFNPIVRNSRDNAMSGNVMFAAHARLKDLEAKLNDPNLVAAGAPMMGHEHMSHLLTSMNSLSYAIRNARFEDETPNLKEKLTSVSDIINSMHAHLSKIADHLEPQAVNVTNKQEFDLKHAAFLSTTHNLASTGLSLDRDEALKVMDLVNRYHTIETAAGMESKPEKSYPTVKAIVTRAENFEEQDWREMFASAPHAIFSLSERSSIPSEALNGSKYEQFLEPSKNYDENKAKTAFARETKNWFSKMSKEDLGHHGKKLLHMYDELLGKKEIMHNDYVECMEEGLKYVGSSMSHKEVKDLVRAVPSADMQESLMKSAVENGVGGVETLKEYARTHEDAFKALDTDHKGVSRSSAYDVASKLRPITSSPHIDDELSGKVYDMFSKNPNSSMKAASELLSNKSTPQSTVNKFVDNVLSNHKDDYSRFDQRESSDMATLLMQHPNVSEQQLQELFALSNESFPKYFAPGGRFNPALTNPTYGGKLFRAMPTELPETFKETKAVDQSKLANKVSLQHKDLEKMKEVMALIPAEGMAWAEFKKKYPAQEKSLPNSVRSVFTSANNKPVMPEQFAKAVQGLDDNTKKYHLTFSEWKSDLQRHNPKGLSNLVVQVNNSEESEKELSQDPKLWSLYQHLLQKTNGIGNGSIGMHPTTPHLVSWSRVDVDQDGKAWAIEEYQSDFAQKFRRNLKSLMSEFPSGTKINGHTVTADDMKKYAKTIDNHLSDWSEASMQAVIENAKKQGITKLYMHGAELRGHMSNSGKYTREFWDNKNTKPFTVGFRKIYDENPRASGFKECDYTDYPKSNPSMLNALKKEKLSTKCWVLDLAPTEKKARKPKL